MNISSIFSPRNVTLLVFILVVLFLGATFDMKVGPESFEYNSNPTIKGDRKENMHTTTPKGKENMYETTTKQKK